MELFTLYADGDDLRARFIVHLSDFTTDGSLAPEAVDRAFLERSVREAGDLSHSVASGPDIFIVKIRGSAAIRAFLPVPRARRAVWRDRQSAGEGRRVSVRVGFGGGGFCKKKN